MEPQRLYRPPTLPAVLPLTVLSVTARKAPVSLATAPPEPAELLTMALVFSASVLEFKMPPPL